MITKEKLLNEVGEFTYLWGRTFFIETEQGNFVWSDPEYPGGDNTMSPYKGTYYQYIKKINIPFGLNKGKHFIKNYCGTEFTLTQ